MLIARCSVLLCVALMIGCDKSSQVKSNENENTEVTPQDGTPDVGEQEVAKEYAPPVAEREVAKVGVGKKGRNYGGGLITEPASQYWKAKERIAFEIQIPHALQLYKALNDFKAPKTHEEFMEKIIKEQKIELPELPPGRKYVYDPEKEQLMVERTAPK